MIETSKKYVLDHSPETRVMLDLIRTRAERNASELHRQIAVLKEQMSAAVVKGGVESLRVVQHLKRQAARMEAGLAFEDSVAKNPERHAVEVGAGVLAGHICQGAGPRPIPVPMYAPDDYGIVGGLPVPSDDLG
jgi:hypothetical protein